ncbi:hypothetical protein B0J14DRAFT_707143 [Halenospora varia]|nr:hypothetical protein B0J14DRAFT_707143 [Halenospora varia]
MRFLMAVSVAQGLSLLGSATAAAYTYGSYHGGESEVLRRSPPQANGIQFVCSDFPDVCQNMCWGAFCVDKHTEFLTYDKASASVKRARRKAAGCLDNQKPGNNRCSAGRPGAQPNYNCDEYPFASTKANNQAGATNGKENRCSRCVPSSQNSKQGSTISKGYKDFCQNKAPCNFQVFFANMGNVPHCNPNGSGNCNADSAEQCSGAINIIERREYTAIEARGTAMNGTFIPGPAQFRTYDGVLLTAPHGGTIGQAVYKPVPINETLYEEHIEDHEYDGDAGLVQFDYITANMRSDVDYIKEVVWQRRPKK